MFYFTCDRSYTSVLVVPLWLAAGCLDFRRLCLSDVFGIRASAYSGWPAAACSVQRLHQIISSTCPSLTSSVEHACWQRHFTAVSCENCRFYAYKQTSLSSTASSLNDSAMSIKNITKFTEVFQDSCELNYPLPYCLVYVHISTWLEYFPFFIYFHRKDFILIISFSLLHNIDVFLVFWFDY